jgi:putative phosphoesterase
MTRLFVTADIHGSLNTWMTIEALMKPSDCLVIAGDLFGTRYGNYSHTDFQPDFIREAIQKRSPIYYVYGNCDVPSFFPGYGSTLGFTKFEKNIFLHHGHGTPPIPENTDIIISGHTHCCFLEKKGSRIFMNPGSLTSPRNKVHTYGIIDKFKAEIWDLKTGDSLGAIAI